MLKRIYYLIKNHNCPVVSAQNAGLCFRIFHKQVCFLGGSQIFPQPEQNLANSFFILLWLENVVPPAQNERIEVVWDRGDHLFRICGGQLGQYKNLQLNEIGHYWKFVLLCLG